MKSVYSLVYLLFLTGAVSGADLKIGIVDMYRIYRDSAPAQRAAKKFDKEFEGRQQDLQKLSEKGKALQDALDKGNLPDLEFKAKQRELIKITQDFERTKHELNEDISARRHQEMAHIQERTKQVVRQIAEGEQFDLILSEQDVPYYNPRLDITHKALKILSK